MGDDNNDKNFLHTYAVFVTGLAFLYIFTCSFFEIPKDNVRFVDTTLGFLLGTVVSTIVQFFYGTSRGSQLKDAMIANMRSFLDNLSDKTPEEICKENKDKI